MVSFRVYTFLLRVSCLGDRSGIRCVGISTSLIRYQSSFAKWPDYIASQRNLVWIRNRHGNEEKSSSQLTNKVSKDSRERHSERKSGRSYQKPKDRAARVQHSLDPGQVMKSRTWLAPPVSGPATWTVMWERKSNYRQMTLVAASTALSERSRLRKVFKDALSMRQLFSKLWTVPRDQLTEFDYVAFISELCQRTDFGRHNSTGLLYRDYLRFRELVHNFCFRDAEQSSELAWAVFVGMVHILGGQKLMKLENIQEIGRRLRELSLDSKVVLLDGLSYVSSKRKGLYHVKLFLNTVQTIHQQMFVSLKGGADGKRQRVRHYSNEHLLVAARAIARSNCYTDFVWSAVCRAFTVRTVSFLPGEIGELACAVGFAKVNTIGANLFFKVLAEACENDVHAFSFIDRVDVVWAGLAHNNWFGPNTIHALLSEAFFVGKRFLEQHPYKALFLHDILTYISIVQCSLIKKHRDLMSLCHYLRLFKLAFTVHDHPQPSAQVCELTSSLLSATPANDGFSDDRNGSEEELLPAEHVSFGQFTTRKARLVPVEPAVNASERADSVKFDVNISGVCVSMAVLADNRGRLVPWTSVEAILAGEPKLWSHYKKMSNTEISSSEDNDSQKSSPDSATNAENFGSGQELFGIADLPHGKEFGWRKQRIFWGGDDQDDLIDEVLHLGREDFVVEDILRSINRWPAYIDLPRSVIKSLNLRPVAVQVLNRKRCMLQPYKSDRFNGNVQMQSSLLRANGWKVVRVCADELSDELERVRVEALLHYVLSNSLSLASRPDLREHVAEQILVRYPQMTAQPKESVTPSEGTPEMENLKKGDDSSMDAKVSLSTKARKSSDEKEPRRTGRVKSRFGRRRSGVSVHVYAPGDDEGADGTE